MGTWVLATTPIESWSNMGATVGTGWLVDMASTHVTTSATKLTSSHSIIISEPTGIFLLNMGLRLCLSGRRHAYAHQCEKCEKKGSFHNFLLKAQRYPPILKKIKLRIVKISY